MPVSPRRRIAVALWSAVGLVVARSAFLLAMNHIGHGMQLSFALRALAGALPREVAAALAAAFLGAWILRPNAKPAMQVAAVLAAAAGYYLALSGWALGDLRNAPSPSTSRGQAAIAGLAGFSAAGAWLVCRVLAGSEGRTRVLWALAVPAFLLAAGPFALRTALAQRAPEMTVTHILGEVLDHPDALESVHGEHRVGVLCPTTDWRLDGGDMPALLLDPPAASAFTVPAANGPVTFRAAAGIDRSNLTHLPPGAVDVGVRFEVRVNDQVRFDETGWIRREGVSAERPWLRVGGDAGIELLAGDRVELRTSVPDGFTRDALGGAMHVGFGGLRMEQSGKRERLAATRERPNIVLFVMDTLRRDRLSTYGYPKPTSPNLDRLAARGQVFEQAYSSASYTWPSTASILTGLQPTHHGVLNGDSCYLSTRIQSLPEVLQEHGYSTGAWSGNPLISRHKNFDQGFESFHADPVRFRKADHFLSEALDWMELCGDRRFFLYVQLTEPHSPLVPDSAARALLAPDVDPEFASGKLHQKLWLMLRSKDQSQLDRVLATVSPQQRDWLSASYDACVRTGDERLGRLLDKVDALGIEDKTVIAFTSDHGESMFEHDLIGHGQTLYGEVVEVPLVLAGPGIPAGSRIDIPVSNRHLAPTLARYAGAQLSDIPDPQILGGERGASPQPVMFSTRMGWWNGRTDLPLFGVRSGNHVLHWTPEGGDWGATQPSELGGVQLFDVVLDPDERVDRTRERPELTEKLRELLEVRQAQLTERRVGGSFGAGSGTLEMLRGVGYIGPDDE